MIRFQFGILTLATLLFCNTTDAGNKKKGEPEAYQEITVSTSEEFYLAVGSNRTIYIDADTLNLTSLSGFKMGNDAVGPTDHVRIDWGMNIHHVRNLTIRPLGNETVVLLDDFKEHITLSFDSCAGVSLSNLIIGHLPQENAFCEKEVIAIRDCQDFDFDSVGLFGTGAQGFVAFESQNIFFGNCEIYDCSQGAMTIRNSTVFLEGCDIYDIDVYYAAIKVFGQSELGAHGCKFEKLWGVETFLIDAAEESYLDFYDCSFINNKGKRQVNGEGVVIMEECTFDRNRFTEEE
jgi:hypothetical protein